MERFFRRAAVLIVYPTLVFAFLLPAIGLVTIHGGILTSVFLGLLFSAGLFTGLSLMDMANDVIDSLKEPEQAKVKHTLGWLMVLGFFLAPGILLKLMGFILSSVLTVPGFTWVVIAGVAIMLGGLIVRLALVD